MSLEKLNRFVLIEIFKNLNISSICQIAKTCKKFNAIIKTNYFWERSALKCNWRELTYQNFKFTFHKNRRIIYCSPVALAHIPEAMEFGKDILIFKRVDRYRVPFIGISMEKNKNYFCFFYMTHISYSHTIKVGKAVKFEKFLAITSRKLDFSKISEQMDLTL